MAKCGLTPVCPGPGWIANPAKNLQKDVFLKNLKTAKIWAFIGFYGLLALQKPIKMQVLGCIICAVEAQNQGSEILKNVQNPGIYPMPLTYCNLPLRH